MQTSRIKPEEYYQTKKGIGKCISVGQKIKMEIEGKVVYLSSTDVQHEIAKGEEPQEKNEDDRPQSKAQANASTLSLPKHKAGRAKGEEPQEKNKPNEDDNRAAHIAGTLITNHINEARMDLAQAAKREDALPLLKAAMHILRAYGYGYPAKLLAEEVADAIEKALIAKGETP